MPRITEATLERKIITGRWDIEHRCRTGVACVRNCRTGKCRTVKIV